MVTSRAFEQQDALDVLDRWDTPDTTFFIDPPYLASTASWHGHNQRRKNVYRHGMCDDDTHQTLLTRLNPHQQGNIAVGGRDNHLYNQMLAEWKRTKLGHVGDVTWVK